MRSQADQTQSIKRKGKEKMYENILGRQAVNEAIILGKLNNPFIVRYIESFIEDSCLNIIM